MTNKIQQFIEENFDYIYQYINDEVLKDIGKMNYDYFKKTMNDLVIDKVDVNLLPYLVLTYIDGNGKIDYTSLRLETIDFTQINKEASTYYNYAQLSLEENILFIELKQMKIGGMPIDKDIVKFSKEVKVKSSGLEEFILENKNKL